MKINSTRILKFFLLLGLVLFVSCSVVIKDFEQYASIKTSKAPLAPSFDAIQTKQTKVAFYNIEDKTTKNKNSAVSNITSSLIKETLGKTNVGIVDRLAIDKLGDEAILSASEFDQELEFTAAKYAITGQIDSVNSYSAYTPGYYEIIPAHEAILLDGSRKYVPAESVYHHPLCTYTGEVQGRFEVYLLPALELTLNIPLNGKGVKTVTQQNFQSSLLSITDNSLLAFGLWAISTNNLDNRCKDQNLQASALNLAARNTISGGDKKKLLNKFAAKGYVSDIRKHAKKNKYIIQITIGNKNGVNQNGTLNVYRQKSIIDALSGKEKIDNVLFAKARVSQLVEGDSAWLVVKDKDEAKKILIGDTVKVIY